MAKNRSTIVSVFFINIIGALIFSFFCNLYYYNFIDSIVKKNILQKTIIQNEIAFANIDQELYSIANIGAVYLTDKNNKPHDIKESSAETQLTFIENLQKISLSFPTIIAIDEYFPHENLIITNGQNFHFLEGEENSNYFLPWLEDYQKSTTPSVFLANGKNRYPLNQDNVVTFAIKSPLFSENTEGMMALHINPKFFKTHLNEEVGCFLIFDRNNNLVYESENTYSCAAIIQKYLHDKTLQPVPNIQSILLKSDVVDYHVNYEISEILGLTYIYVTPYGNLFGQKAYLRNFIFSSLFFFFQNLLTMLFLAYKSDNVYKKRISYACKDIGLDADKSDKFDNSLSKLETQFSSLHSRVESSEPILVQNALRLLFLGRNTDADYDEIRKRFPHSHILVVILSHASHEITNQEITAIFSQCNGLYEFLVTTVYKEHVAVLNFQENRISEIRNHFDTHLKAQLCEYELQVSSIQTISKDSFSMCFKMVQTLLGYRFILPKSNVYLFDSLDITRRKATGNLTKVLLGIENSIKTENSSSFTRNLQTLLVSMYTDNFTIEYCRATTRDLVSILHRAFKEKGLDSWGILGYDIREHYEHIPHIEELFVWFNSCFIEFIEILDQKRETYDKDNIKEQILALLQENPEKDLTLDYLADKLGLRSDELSRAFKIFFGENFSDYLRKAKIEKAKEFLDEGLLVKDVASLLGYSTAQYFIKVFKTETGKTPNQYKKI